MKTIQVNENSKPWNPKLGYLVAFPSGYDKSKKYPLIIFLHGTGEGGRNEWDLDNNGPLREASLGKEIEAIILAPQFPADNGWWNEVAIDWIAEMIQRKDFQEEYNIYPKIGVTGLSAGSRGAVMFAIRHHQLVSSVSIVAVRGYDLKDISNAKDIPFWILTNKGDTNDWAALLKIVPSLGGTVKTSTKDGQTTLWEGSSHDSWTRAYKIDELYEWHIEHSTPKAEPIPVEPEPIPEPTLTEQIQTKFKELGALIEKM